MLKEWFEYIATPAPRYARQMGYVSQVIATKARYGRQQKAWRKHIENTKQVIIDAANAAPHKRKVVVLGAGNLIDVPLARLATMFEEVVLVDVAFLRCTKRLAKKHSATIVTADITNAAELMLAGDVAAARAATPDLLLGDDTIDLVISCNIASQLPFNLVPYLTDKNEQAQYDFCAEIIQKHLDYMNQFTCMKLVVSDITFFVMEGENVQSEPALCGVRLPELNSTWRWDIAPRGEAGANIKEWHQVGAVIL